VAKIKVAMAARGRDPGMLSVRTMLPPAPGTNGLCDLEATLAHAPELRAAGATHLEFYPTMFCRDETGLEAFFDRLAAWKEAEDRA
jgi:hypothetical protein